MPIFWLDMIMYLDNLVISSPAKRGPVDFPRNQAIDGRESGKLISAKRPGPQVNVGPPVMFDGL